ncbi:hypothetical protein MA16_Dca022492 [Dendrobium catenatum]|uniref:Uncharacterized protein n=1 Tax=Dendrobium catenatum TaxID=906689 RepID=A0A2I0XFZ7_9ASPA|nr:hypothetical protein MA16_Dca022492 [Dendrobium catenatum]
MSLLPIQPKGRVVEGAKSNANEGAGETVRKGEDYLHSRCALVAFDSKSGRDRESELGRGEQPKASSLLSFNDARRSCGGRRPQPLYVADFHVDLHKLVALSDKRPNLTKPKPIQLQTCRLFARAPQAVEFMLWSLVSWLLVFWLLGSNASRAFSLVFVGFPDGLVPGLAVGMLGCSVPRLAVPCSLGLLPILIG